MRSRFRLKRWTVFAVLAVVGSTILSACNGSPAFIDPKGPVAYTESNIWWGIFAVCVVIFVGVTSVLLYSVIRFRARPDSPEPRQIHGNTRIEIIWTIAPTVVLMIILAVTIGTMFGPLQQPTGVPTLNVKAIGHQWWFEFSYPSENNVVTADELHVPVGEVISVSLVSDNVIHGFWVPQLAGKMDIIPGHNNVLWFKADVAGTYRGACTEFCGAQHAHMDFVVVAQSPADYAAWIAAQQNPPVTPAAGSPEANGATLFKSSGCSGCHAIGTPPANAFLIGPNLTHFGSRLLIAGGVLDNNSTNLAKWVSDAQAIKPDSDMPAFNGSAGSQGNLSASQISDLVAYLESLK